METLLLLLPFFSLLLFKSYYVVWKPVNTGTTVNRQFEFKSYYVVWKPTLLFAIIAGGGRLNRTM